MANDSVSVSGPINVQSDSKERVAFELMEKIDIFSEVRSESKDKAYWLTLYSQCLSTVRGGSVSRILGAD